MGKRKSQPPTYSGEGTSGEEKARWIRLKGGAEVADKRKNFPGRKGVPGAYVYSDHHVYIDEELEFMRAVEAYKKKNRRQFPALSELYRILLSLGYRKVEGVADESEGAVDGAGGITDEGVGGSEGRSGAAGTGADNGVG